MGVFINIVRYVEDKGFKISLFFQKFNGFFMKKKKTATKYFVDSPIVFSRDNLDKNLKFFLAFKRTCYNNF